MAAGAPTEIRGAAVWAKGAVAYGHLARLTQPALVDGAIGVVVAPQGRLVRALRFTIVNDKITEIEVIGNPARVRARRVDRRLRIGSTAVRHRTKTAAPPITTRPPRPRRGLADTNLPRRGTGSRRGSSR